MEFEWRRLKVPVRLQAGVTAASQIRRRRGVDFSKWTGEMRVAVLCALLLRPGTYAAGPDDYVSVSTGQQANAVCISSSWSASWGDYDDKFERGGEYCASSWSYTDDIFDYNRHTYAQSYNWDRAAAPSMPLMGCQNCNDDPNGDW